MIYRHLRQLENDGLVLSEWETEGAGPARRVYRLTAEGREMLDLWIEYMKKELARLKKAHPRMTHQARFKKAAASWKRSKGGKR